MLPNLNKTAELELPGRESSAARPYVCCRTYELARLAECCMLDSEANAMSLGITLMAVLCAAGFRGDGRELFVSDVTAVSRLGYRYHA